MKFCQSTTTYAGQAVEKASGQPAPENLRTVLAKASDFGRHEPLASQLSEAEHAVVMLGQAVLGHAEAALLRALAAYIAQATGSALNVLAPGANSAGAWQAGAVPNRGPGGAFCDAGMNVVQMLNDPRQTYLLWDAEPDLDIDNPAGAMKALEQAEHVIAVVSHAADSLRQVADILLPLAPLAESEGTTVNLDGSFASFAAAGRAMGEARPGWKILRLVGTALGLEGFGQFAVEDVLSEARAQIDSAEVSTGEATPVSAEPEPGLYRIGELPMYSIDALCRRSEPLQGTAHAKNLFVALNPEDAARLNLGNGDTARVRQGNGQAELEVKISDRVPVGGAWLRGATVAASKLGCAYAPVTVEVA